MVLIVGGFNGSDVNNGTAELYDPARGTFTQTLGNPIEARQHATATLINGGMVLIAGGYTDFAETGAFASVEIYDDATGTFSPTGNMNAARGGPTATLLNNGMVLIAGGYGGTDGSNNFPINAEIFAPSTNTFTATGNMNTDRGAHSATLLNRGEVLVAGGEAVGNVAISVAVLSSSVTCPPFFGPVITKLPGFLVPLQRSK